MSPTATAVLSVTAYAARVQRAAKSAGSAVVEGEVQKPRRTGGGAFLFELTDGRSHLACKVVPWTLRRGLRCVPREGDLVRARAEYPDFWPEAGRLSILIDDIELAGDGELLRRREDLIRRLGAEGLCDPRRFPPLPRFPRGVGVVAGHGSDALRDVVQGLGDRFPGAAAVIACCAARGPSSAGADRRPGPPRPPLL